MSTKKRITTFYLDDSLVNDFDKFCENNDKTRSKVANRLIKDFIDSKKKR